MSDAIQTNDDPDLASPKPADSEAITEVESETLSEPKATESAALGWRGRAVMVVGLLGLLGAIACAWRYLLAP